MRPHLLNPFFMPLASLKGIGPTVARKLEKLVGGASVLDLVYHLPREILYRKLAHRVRDLRHDSVATLQGTIGLHHPGRPYRVEFLDAQGDCLPLVFFHGNRSYLEKRLPVDRPSVISGRVENFSGFLQMAHPDYIEKPENLSRIPQYEPIYPLTAGVGNRQFRQFIAEALREFPDLPEWLEASDRTGQDSWPGFLECLRLLHHPDRDSALDPVLSPARLRLSYDELLAGQLALVLLRRRLRQQQGRILNGKGNLRQAMRAALPFDLTASQDQAIEEILTDMRSPVRMLRLLQGDVGTGKTLVALAALLNAVETGAQAALLAPTEILARQHFKTLSGICDQIGVKVGLLLGRGRAPTQERRAALNDLKDGTLQIAVGTHALFQEDVTFPDLAAVVIDEQHRFGVHQRLSLSGKGAQADLLVMTATPIPRTLMLSSYGDLDHSRLTEKPPGRQKIVTAVASLSRLSEVIERIALRLEAGEQAYWVCPLIEETEGTRFTPVETRTRILKEAIAERLGPEWAARVELIHGRMAARDKDAAMRAFVEGETRLLVATTVVEVGVDVPEATIIVIEHAEHFGLAQLHQLRGRVGRGDKASSCLLLRAEHISLTAKERLKVMTQSDDGFDIAEKDLHLRGAGEVLGARQSGLPTFSFVDIAVHGHLMDKAAREARAILEKDPHLSGMEAKNLRLLLYLFRYDRAMDYLLSG